MCRQAAGDTVEKNTGDGLMAYFEDGGQQGEPGSKRAVACALTMMAATLTVKPMAQADVFRMIKRRAREAGIKTEIGCHTFRATGITAYLKNGGRLEVAQQMAAHESARTTGLYDRRGDEISLDEVERIAI
jgi:site-specific recombinase XerD